MGREGSAPAELDILVRYGLISALGYLERRQEAELAITELHRKKPGTESR